MCFKALQSDSKNENMGRCVIMMIRREGELRDNKAIPGEGELWVNKAIRADQSGPELLQPG